MLLQEKSMAPATVARQFMSNGRCTVTSGRIGGISRKLGHAYVAKSERAL
jgi:hypothetical protein